MVADPKPNNTVAEHWEAFFALVMPDGAGDVQREEMRRTFYAGFATAFTQINVLSEGDESVAFAVLTALNAELHNYMRAMISELG